MKTIETKNGTRWIERMEPTDRLWAVFKENKPAYLSVSEYSGRTSFTVWGRTQLECRNNLSDLTLRLSAVSARAQEPAAAWPEPKRPRRGDAFECKRCAAIHGVCEACAGLYDD